MLMVYQFSHAIVKGQALKFQSSLNSTHITILLLNKSPQLPTDFHQLHQHYAQLKSKMAIKLLLLSPVIAEPYSRKNVKIKKDNKRIHTCLPTKKCIYYQNVWKLSPASITTLYFYHIYLVIAKNPNDFLQEEVLNIQKWKKIAAKIGFGLRKDIYVETRNKNTNQNSNPVRCFCWKSKSMNQDEKRINS